ncbi:molybdopterin-binding protein [Mycobacterium sp. E796]|uniref:molybdopterin-binding protein n=1 Tax=Mycobacterium sp. E796 TaxID=1834151 RepID=UPI0007FBE7AF|nr:molybdopterin-binding protein [Mycobacterium sp. E796]OBI52006.1 hypothetical protein A5706_02075 [Mycobacterium sp. E796]
MTEIELLDKTELWVSGVTVDHVHLVRLADVVAATLSLPREKLLVTDVRDDRIVFDVLQPRMRIADLAGKEAALLAAVADVPGVQLAKGAAVHSRGVLGVIGLPTQEVSSVLEDLCDIDRNVRAYVGRRVAVISTGGEVSDGRVRDTNLEAATSILGGAGYEVAAGGVVPDDEVAIAGRVALLASEGFGIILTTGGIGAEDKDRTIEALQMLDPNLATAVLARFEPGKGRHAKDSIRVAVAVTNWSIVIALPGPTDEVLRALPELVSQLNAGATPGTMVEAIAEVLRAPLRPAR